MNEGAVRLRPLGGDDVGEILPLLAQLGYEMSDAEAANRVGGVLAASDHMALVAEADGRVVGLMHVFVRPALENPREAVVEAIVVDERYRCLGAGRALMAAAERWAREHRCRSVALSSNIVRAPAHAFYRALGYRIAATSYVLRKPLGQE
jgi:GNAT superfamily N-acetyltransferase